MAGSSGTGSNTANANPTGNSGANTPGNGLVDKARSVGNVVLAVCSAALTFFAITVVAAVLFSFLGLSALTAVLGIGALIGGGLAAYKVYGVVKDNLSKTQDNQPQATSTSTELSTGHSMDNQRETVPGASVQGQTQSKLSPFPGAGNPNPTPNVPGKS